MADSDVDNSPEHRRPPLFQPLRELLGDAAESALPGLLATFLQSAREHLQAARNAHARIAPGLDPGTAADDLRRAAHTLKSLGAGIGAWRLADIAEELEQLMKAHIATFSPHTGMQAATLMEQMTEELTYIDAAINEPRAE